MDNIELFITFGGFLFGLLMLAVGVFLIVFGYGLPQKNKSSSALLFGVMMIAAGGWGITVNLQTSKVLPDFGTYTIIDELLPFTLVSFVPYTFLWFVLDRVGVSIKKSWWKWYFVICGGGILFITTFPWSGMYRYDAELGLIVRRGEFVQRNFSAGPAGRHEAEESV